MAQNWHDLLFAHWPVRRDLMRSLVPKTLEIDEFRGQAWISVVPFTMSGVRLRGTPAVPWLSRFPELNVRTYVVSGGKPGVWFFSLDAANPVAVQLARRWFHLPYFHAHMKSVVDEGRFLYSSRRADRRCPEAEIRMNYSPRGSSFNAREETLEYFLAERYCLYAQKQNGEILRGEIHHAPWSLREASASFEINTMAAGLGLELSAPPAMMHFSKLQEVIAWWPEKVAV